MAAGTMQAYSRIDPQELVTLADRWGGICHIARSQWESGKTMLRPYRSTGLSVSAHNELIHGKDSSHIHRENLRPEGYSAAAEEAHSRQILAGLME
jgi:hypothetical protein